MSLFDKYWDERCKHMTPYEQRVLLNKMQRKIAQQEKDIERKKKIAIELWKIVGVLAIIVIVIESLEYLFEQVL